MYPLYCYFVVRFPFAVCKSYLSIKKRSVNKGLLAEHIDVFAPAVVVDITDVALSAFIRSRVLVSHIPTILDRNSNCSVSE